MSCAFPTLFPTGAADFLAPRPLAVTIGNYLKHMMMFEDGRFAKHPRFRYFALNTEMRWRALQAGRIYVRQHPHDAQLTVEELRVMKGRCSPTVSSTMPPVYEERGTTGSNSKVASLPWMVDTLGLPSVLHSQCCRPPVARTGMPHLS